MTDNGEGAKVVRLGDIVQEFELEVLRGGTDYEDAPVRTFDVNRPGLPLSGFFEHFDTERLLVIGLTETTYLKGMDTQLHCPARRLRKKRSFSSPRVTRLAAGSLPTT